MNIQLNFDIKKSVKSAISVVISKFCYTIEILPFMQIITVEDGFFLYITGAQNFLEFRTIEKKKFQREKKKFSLLNLIVGNERYGSMLC